MDQTFEKNMDRVEEKFNELSTEVGADEGILTLEDFEIFWNRVKTMSFHNHQQFFDILQNVC